MVEQLIALLEIAVGSGKLRQTDMLRVPDWDGSRGLLIVMRDLGGGDEYVGEIDLFDGTITMDKSGEPPAP